MNETAHQLRSSLRLVNHFNVPEERDFISVTSLSNLFRNQSVIVWSMVESGLPNSYFALSDAAVEWLPTMPETRV